MNSCNFDCNQGRTCHCGAQTPVLDFALALAIGAALAFVLVVWWSA